MQRDDALPSTENRCRSYLNSACRRLLPLRLARAARWTSPLAVVLSLPAPRCCHWQFRRPAHCSRHASHRRVPAATLAPPALPTRRGQAAQIRCKLEMPTVVSTRRLRIRSMAQRRQYQVPRRMQRRVHCVGSVQSCHHSPTSAHFDCSGPRVKYRCGFRKIQSSPHGHSRATSPDQSYTVA